MARIEHQSEVHGRRPDAGSARGRANQECLREPPGGYHDQIVGGCRLRWLAVLLSVIAGSQLGHTLAYLSRYGVAAGRYESTGVHAYYPTLSAALGGGVGLALSIGLLLVAVARALFRTPPGSRLRGSVRFLDILAPVFVAQLMVFVAQESIEAVVGGHAAPSVGDDILWGTLGQLPAAVVAAALIAWLLTRLEAAWTAIVEGAPRLTLPPSTPALERATWFESDARLRLNSDFSVAFRKRGPPRRPVLT